MGEAEKLRHSTRVDQILGVNPRHHRMEITSVVGSIRGVE